MRGDMVGAAPWATATTPQVAAVALIVASACARWAAEALGAVERSRTRAVTAATRLRLTPLLP
ncbi:hypothetical protein GCM10025789_01910 [Tessaracoccus lubricantis]|uniref:Uncharacterized protein n=1 Tax=Tessaracoccus lubricantis TaxID=545543 RepID=A0ABP9EX29_9ACTN